MGFFIYQKPDIITLPKPDIITLPLHIKIALAQSKKAYYNQSGKKEMRHLFIWVVFYCLLLASSQITLKSGASQLGGFTIKGLADIFPLLLRIIANPMILLGTLLMASSFLLWVYILSWLKLGLVFPLTAMTYIFVALLSYFFLAEKLSLINYFGIVLVAAGIFFLLYK